MTAKSFCLPAAGPDVLARTLAELKDAALGDARNAPPLAGGIVFVSGALALEPKGVAEVVRTAWRGVPACVVPAAGVLNEKSELEGVAAASGVLWKGGRVAPFVVGQAPSDKAAEVLRRASCAVLFTRPDAFQPAEIEKLGLPSGAQIFGAGTVGTAPVIVSSDGTITQADACGLAIAGLAPFVDTSAACKLLTPFYPIDEVLSGMVLRLGGRPALDVLSALGGQAASEGTPPIVFAALADESEPAGRERYVVRPIRGIDPGRRGVMVGAEARIGTRLAFAARDAAAGRELLEQSARQVSVQTTGASARFLLYFTCAGRGQGLYGSPGVESRILRKRFGDLPIAGMHSSFELLPRAAVTSAEGARGSGPQVRVAMYSGVLALFRSPS